MGKKGIFTITLTATAAFGSWLLLSASSFNGVQTGITPVPDTPDRTLVSQPVVESTVVNDVALPPIAYVPKVEPSINTKNATKVDHWSATLGGIIASEGNSPVTEHGVCWGSDIYPDFSDNRVPVGSGQGEFSLLVTGFMSDTVYYCRAYAINADGLWFGETRSFQTTTGNGLPVVSVSASGPFASEEGPSAGSWTLTRTGDTSAALEVHFTMVGTAQSALDYVLDTTIPVTIPVGQASVTIMLTPVDDTVLFEGDETATLDLSPNEFYLVGTMSATITISDNDTGPEISVLGNGLEIVSGDDTPELADGTDFGNVAEGSSATATFTISNVGANDLSLTGTPPVTVNTSDFSITADPVTPVTSSGSTTFTVTFSPTMSGLQTATVSIDNDDPDETPYTFIVQGVGESGPIIDVSLRNGLTVIGYTGANPIPADVVFTDLITDGHLVNVRWIDPSSGFTRELYESPVFGWVNNIGDLTLGQGYVVRTRAACTLSISGNKSTASVTHNLRTLSVIGFNKETPMDAEVAFAELITAGKLLNVRWIDPAGFTRELYESPVFGWVNNIGDLIEGQGYVIRLNSAHAGFALP